MISPPPPPGPDGAARSRNDPCWCGSGKRFKSCHGALGSVAPVGADRPPTPADSAARLAQLALDAQLDDDLVLAETRYRACLALDPKHADALHMLGVVRLAAFDFAEARQLIESAGALTGWRFAPFRHNYGYLLSAYLPASGSRPSASQHAALKALREQYAQREPSQSARCAFLLRSHSSLLRESPASSRASDAPDVAGDPIEPRGTALSLSTLHLPTDDAQTRCEHVQNLLGGTNADYIAFASAETPPDPLRTAALIELLEQSRGGWGFSTPSYAADALEVRARWPAVLADAAAGLSNAQFTENVSAMCFATPLLPLSIDNLVVRRSLLMDVAWAGIGLTHALTDIVLALCQRDEPCVCATAPLAVTAANARALARDFESLPGGQRAQHRYIVDALANARFANPFAPSLASQGLSFLKRPLRHGVGAQLDADVLADIARRIDAVQLNSPALRNDGFDLVGFARAESGLGENLRAFSHALTTTGLPHSIIDIDIETGIRKADHSLDALIVSTPGFRHQLICVNPDSLNEAVHHEGVAAMSSAYKIGYWFWELEKLPLRWNRAAGAFAELWTASEFVRAAVAKSVSIPVYKVPTPIRPPEPSRPYSRAEFGLDDGDFVFLFSFAYGSVIARKNPWATVRAFREAFPAGESKFSRVKLVIKSVQSELFEQEKARLHALAAHDARIVFMDRFMSRDQVMGLQVSADCYVSLHRSEGFGLGMAECMAIGKPVIGTAYSANLDFMNESNSLLVDYSLIPVKPGEYPDHQPQVWADADVDSAARHMRRVFTDATLRNDLGQAAKRFLHAHYSPTAVGALVHTHLRRLNESRNS